VAYSDFDRNSGSDAAAGTTVSHDVQVQPAHGPDFLDIPGNSSTTAVLTVGASVSDVIEIGGDTDWFRVDLVAGQTYIFSLNGAAVGGSAALSDTYLRLMDATGSQIAYDDDGGPGNNSLLSFTASTTGTYFLNAGAYSTYTGGYTLSWAPPLPTYTMDQVASYLASGYWADTGRSWHAFAGGTITYNITNLTADGQRLAEEAFHAWAGVTGLNFVATTGAAQISFDDNQSGAYANYVSSGNVTQSATVNVDTGWLSTYGTGRNSYSLQTYIHEIGHTLGLGHAGNYNGSAGWSATIGGDNHFLNDSWQATIMSYFDQDQNASVNASHAFVVGPMLADIIAIQSLYGVPTNVRAGNTTYGFNSNSIAEHDFSQYTQGDMVAFGIFDSGGTDTIDTSGFSAAQLIDLRPGTYSNIGGEVGNIGIAFNTVIENATGGSGSDQIIGNVTHNVLMGGAGADFIYGGEGWDTIWGNSSTAIGGFTDGGDTLYGEGGNDLIYGNQGFDFVSGGSGSDTIYGGLDGDTIWGNDPNAVGAFPDGSDTIYGQGGNDIIYGNQDNDFLYGGEGADTIYGGLGNDTIWGNEPGAIGAYPDGVDIIYGQDGHDTIYGNQEGDYLFGGTGYDTIYGGLGNDFIYGNEVGADAAWDSDDALYGQDGNDTIHGQGGNDFIFGGAGIDHIHGGFGNDTLYGHEPGNGTADSQDFFYFQNGWGFDAIGDFNVAQDVLNFTALASFGIHSMQDLSFSNYNGNMVIAFGGSNIQFLGVGGGVTTANFLFA
jgi:serralysin